MVCTQVGRGGGGRRLYPGRWRGRGLEICRRGPPQDVCQRASFVRRREGRRDLASSTAVGVGHGVLIPTFQLRQMNAKGISLK